ncbi:hypothetical protein J8273_1391 [Carpediemonas membranifera]|uniref:Uncharacterized protein n=1 Tax=Carpediemonas membranifera TaxID=201153 RepID=A0A8J6BB40_9EUKA|nr:hypothetical protein J8273_1391 [Carpediemonas membranifera]|eukprot:KAG9397034.1 hypothetical protein J8273_1391 [Carpediemonas membranifera]
MIVLSSFALPILCLSLIGTFISIARLHSRLVAAERETTSEPRFPLIILLARLKHFKPGAKSTVKNFLWTVHLLQVLHVVAIGRFVVANNIVPTAAHPTALALLESFWLLIATLINMLHFALLVGVLESLRPGRRVVTFVCYIANLACVAAAVFGVSVKIPVRGAVAIQGVQLVVAALYLLTTYPSWHSSARARRSVHLHDGPKACLAVLISELLGCLVLPLPLAGVPYIELLAPMMLGIHQRYWAERVR